MSDTVDTILNYADPLVAAVARHYMILGDAYHVNILAVADSKLEQTGYDNWNGGTYLYTLYLSLPPRIFSEQSENIPALKKDLLVPAELMWVAVGGDNHILQSIEILPILKTLPEWQQKALDWVNGSGVTNQGRVRSNNIASRECDGLLFRSQPEIHLYKALKRLGVSFAPLPVVLRGGKEYKRIEPDFVIFRSGMFTIVEVDGDTVHTESAAEAQARTTLLEDEGAYIIHISSQECDTEDKAKKCAKDLIDRIHRQLNIRS